jgi:Asp/Glu/hydantoin racemase
VVPQRLKPGITREETVMKARIALIHATPVAMEPIRKAFAADWGEAELVNLLDDSLSADLAAAGRQSPEIKRRMASLAVYAQDIGADAVLFTCSAFGDAIDLARQLVSVPVLKPNEAMFAEAMDAGAVIGMVATFGPSVASMENEFHAMATDRNRSIRLKTLLAADAMTALRRGDQGTHDRLVAETAARLGHCDAVLLAHFSTSSALSLVKTAVSIPVLTSPHSAVAKLKAALASPAPLA